MFGFPINTRSDAASNSFAASQMLAFSGKLRTASAQFNELNLQAARRLMEESRADFLKAAQAHTFTEAQRLFAEQSKASIEKVVGYWQNVGNIVLETWGSPRRSVGAVETSDEATEPTVPLNDAFMKAPAVLAKPHEVDIQPSPLVEKLVASVSVDATKPRS
jgi:hypothetical protein